MQESSDNENNAEQEADISDGLHNKTFSMSSCQIFGNSIKYFNNFLQTNTMT